MSDREPETPASSDLSTLDVKSSPFGAFGSYKLLQRLGEGGMGEVWLAEQTESVHRQVALKVIKSGMDSAQVVARFEAERQALAIMDHPAIATVFDGGTTPQGRPYFAMEYVRGEPITTYCDRHRLSNAERLELFIRVCEGVQHAHQKGIIHRDLKPSNILVAIQDDRPVPKIIDFGVAKAVARQLGDHSFFTELGALIGTPEYMSPEQAEMGALNIDIRTDIYALGVVLYELLTGKLPFDRKELRQASLSEIQRLIREKEPVRPSTRITQGGPASEEAAQNRRTVPARLASQLKGDLDWITIKALEKDRTRRYGSASDLAADLQRHREHEPVLAGPPSTIYRTRKFIQRNRILVTAVALVLVTLLAGIVATTQSARIARMERARAERRFNDVRKLANSFLFEVHDAIENLPGSTRARQLLVTRALEYLDSLAREAGGDTALRQELATAYQKVGDVQGNPYFGNLGDLAGAQGSYRKAMAIREELYRANPADHQARRDLAASYNRMEDVLHQSNDISQALDYSRRSLDLREQLSAESPADVEDRRLLASSHERVGESLAAMGKTDDCRAQLQEALSIRQALATANPTNAEIHRALATSHAKLGQILGLAGDNRGALEHGLKAKEIRERLSAQDSTNAPLRRELSASLIDIGNLLSEEHRTKEALESFRQVLSMREELARADPSNAQASRDLAIAHGTFASTLQEAGDREGAKQHSQQALVLFEKLSARNPESRSARRDLFLCLYYLGEIQLKCKEPAQAAENYRKALSIAETLAAQDPASAAHRRDVANSCFGIGESLAALASDPAASTAMQRARWIEARAFYARCRDTWLDIQKRGEFKALQRESIDEATKSISTCDQALAKLPPP